MQIIDRYIIRQFLMNFVILLVVFMTMFVIGDVMIEMDEFIDAGGEYAEENDGSVLFGTLVIIADYYGPMIAMIYVFFSGVLVVGAMGFTFATMIRNRELLALVASGVNMYRIAMPVLIVGCLLNMMTIVNQELIIPPLAGKLTRAKSDLKKEQTEKLNPITFVADIDGHLFSAAHFDPRRSTLRDLTILERNEEGEVLRRITTGQAIWDEQGGVWDLAMGVGMRHVEGRDPIVEEVPQFETNLSPRVLLLRSNAMYPRLLSFEALQGLMKSVPDKRDVIRQILHSRFSLLVVNVLVLAMGMPFFLRREPGNLFMSSTRAAAVCVGAWTLGLLMLQLGDDVVQVNPAVVAWLPVVILLPVSAILMQFVRT